MNPDTAHEWLAYRELLLSTMYSTVRSSGLKWLSFFHVIGQAGLDCQTAELALKGCTLFAVKWDRQGFMWLSVSAANSKEKHGHQTQPLHIHGHV